MNQQIKIVTITVIAIILMYGFLIFYYDKQDEVVQIANPFSSASALEIIPNGITIAAISEIIKS